MSLLHKYIIYTQLIFTHMWVCCCCYIVLHRISSVCNVYFHSVAAKSHTFTRTFPCGSFTSISVSVRNGHAHTISMKKPECIATRPKKTVRRRWIFFFCISGFPSMRRTRINWPLNMRVCGTVSCCGWAHLPMACAKRAKIAKCKCRIHRTRWEICDIYLNRQSEFNYEGTVSLSDYAKCGSLAIRYRCWRWR